MAEILAGTAGAANVSSDPDRRASIHRAIALAEPGDVVVIAGKGADTEMEIDGRFVPFDDRQVAREALSRGAGSTKPRRSGGAGFAGAGSGHP
jgi:UDP-N-acetylmuramoyl-L-alanyl-D-glutamate--2,6-diaminopimelate ligase